MVNGCPCAAKSEWTGEIENSVKMQPLWIANMHMEVVQTVISQDNVQAET